MDEQTNKLNAELMIALNGLLDEHDVMQLTSLSRTSLYRKRRAGRFPEPEEISDGRVAYRTLDVKAWLDNPTGWTSPQNSLDT